MRAVHIGCIKIGRIRRGCLYYGVPLIVNILEYDTSLGTTTRIQIKFVNIYLTCIHLFHTQLSNSS